MSQGQEAVKRTVLWLPAQPDAYPCNELSSFLETRPNPLPDLRSLDISVLSGADVIKVYSQLCCPPQQAHDLQQQPVASLRPQLQAMQSWYRLCPDTPLGQPVILSHRTISTINVLWRSMSCRKQCPMPDFNGLDGLFVLHVKRNLLASFWMEPASRTDDLLRHLPVLFGLASALPARGRTGVQNPLRNTPSGSHCVQARTSLSEAVRSVTASAKLQQPQSSLARPSPARITADDLNSHADPHSQQRARSAPSANGNRLSPASHSSISSSAHMRHSAPQPLARNALGFSIKGASRSKPSTAGQTIPSPMQRQPPEASVSTSSDCSSTAARRDVSQYETPPSSSAQPQARHASTPVQPNTTNAPPATQLPPCPPSSSSQTRDAPKALFQDPDATSSDSANQTKDTSMSSPLGLRHDQDAEQFVESVFQQLRASNLSSTDQANSYDASAEPSVSSTATGPSSPSPRSEDTSGSSSSSSSPRTTPNALQQPLAESTDRKRSAPCHSSDGTTSKRRRIEMPAPKLCKTVDPMTDLLSDLLYEFSAVSDAPARQTAREFVSGRLGAPMGEGGQNAITLSELLLHCIVHESGDVRELGRTMYEARRSQRET